jgi:hypothetical protein
MSTIETDMDREHEAEGSSRMRQADLADREPREIEDEIDATRADMRATIEALERRFSVERLMDLTVNRIRDRGGEFAGNLTDAATRNPMPLLLTSIGLTWLMLASRSGSRNVDSTYGDSTMSEGAAGAGDGVRNKVAGVRDKIGARVAGARDTLGARVSGARDSASHAADRVHGAVASTRETVQHAAESLRSRAESLRSGATTAAAAAREHADDARMRMDRLLHEQPLMLGALGLAAGAIIGALLPTTEHEDRWLGSARDRTVKDLAQKSRARLEAARDRIIGDSAAGGDSAASGEPASRPH